jgi:CD63 antigen
MVERSMALVKYLMFFFNFLFWLSGLALIVVGAVIKEKYGDYFSYADSKFATTPIFLIVVGVIVAIIGFLGCCGAIKENYCMVTTFAVLLGIVFILEIVAGILGFVYRKQVEESSKDALKRALDDYMSDDQPGASDLLDWAQQKFACCGNDGPEDYNRYGNNGTCGPNNGVQSCHENNLCTGTLYDSGCHESFAEFIRDNLVVIGVVALAIGFVQLLGIIFACMLAKAIKGEYEVV